MPRPIALCLEELHAPTSRSRFVRCVALPGNRPGLAVNGDGSATWLCDATGFELWVSADEQLILLRPEAAPVRVVVWRAGRSLVVPADKPVVLLDQDEVQIGARRLRIHVHGTTDKAHPPAPLDPPSTRPLLPASPGSLSPWQSVPLQLAASRPRLPILRTTRR